jgi:Reverse transcriptase (RNA-dependent DNA polymerase)
VQTDDDLSEWFDVKVGLHQGSALSPLLFIIVMEVVSGEIRGGLPGELLYVDDLVLLTESEVDLRRS